MIKMTISSSDFFRFFRKIFKRKCDPSFINSSDLKFLKGGE